MNENEELTPEEVVESVVEVVVEDVVEEPTPKPAELVAKPKRSKIAEPVAVDLEKVRAELPQPLGEHVVSNGIVDEVSISKIVYRNVHARKSLSVHHLQRRLNELGYEDAFKDQDGWFGDNTRTALVKFQEQNKLDASGTVSRSVLELLFKGDSNVIVVE